MSQYKEGQFLNIDNGTVVAVICSPPERYWHRNPDGSETIGIEPERWVMTNVLEKDFPPFIDLTPEIWARLVSLEEAARIVRKHRTA